MDADPLPLSEPLLRDIAPVSRHLKALRCVDAVVRAGSALRAAEQLHMSQPAVTRAVMDLERFCGLPLFERGGRGLLPTPRGLAVARRAEWLLRHLTAGAAQAAQGARTAPGSAPPAGSRANPGRFSAAVSPASLRAMLAVAATRSESRAAALLGISQPAVHRALLALEHLVGADLFQKSARGTRLTDAGQALLWRIKLAMAEARALQSEIDGWRGGVRGRVVIGALPLSVSLVLPRAVNLVRQRHPDLAISVVDGTYDSLMRQLREADLDLVIGALRAPTSDIVQEPLAEEALAVVARRGHPCLQRPQLCLADLLDWEWVVPLPGTPAGQALQGLFAAAGLSPPQGVIAASSAVFTRALVAQSDRLALTSLGQAEDDARSGALAQVPVDLPQTRRPIGVARRAEGEPSPDVQAVLQALRQARPAASAEGGS